MHVASVHHLAGREMAPGEISLRVQVERLVAETRDERMRVRFVTRWREGARRRLCMEIGWTGRLSLVFFFRHADRSWFLFPPEHRRPGMGNGAAAV